MNTSPSQKSSRQERPESVPQGPAPVKRGISIVSLFWPLWILGTFIWAYLVDSRWGASLDLLEGGTMIVVGSFVILLASVVLSVLTDFLVSRNGGRMQNTSGTTQTDGSANEVGGIVRTVAGFPLSAQAVWRLQTFVTWALGGLLVIAVGSLIFWIVSPFSLDIGTGWLALSAALALVWIAVSGIISRSAYVILEFERLVVFRNGRLRTAEGPGRIQLVPFIDEARFIVETRIVIESIEFNHVPVKSSSGEGFLLVDVQLWLFLEAKDPEKVVRRLRDVFPTIRARAEIGVSNASSGFTVDQVVGRNPKFIEKLEEILVPRLAQWGFTTELGVKDIILPETLQKAYQAAEAAEVQAKGLTILAGAMESVMDSWNKAVMKVLSPSATDAQKVQLFASMFGVEAARALRGEGGGGVPIFADATRLMSGVGVSSPTPEPRTGS